MADGCGLVDYFDAGRLEQFNERLGIVAGRLDELYARVDDCLSVFGIWWRADRREDCEVHAEWPVDQLAAPSNLVDEIHWCRLGECGDESERAGIGHGGDERSGSHP